VEREQASVCPPVVFGRKRSGNLGRGGGTLPALLAQKRLAMMMTKHQIRPRKSGPGEGCKGRKSDREV